MPPPVTLRRAAVSMLLALLPMTDGPGLDLDHPLFRAVRERRDDRVVDLLRQGTPAGLRTGDGTTALMVAALWGTSRSVERLLAHGADPKAANATGATALLWGAGDLDKVRLLIGAGADVHARSTLGNTPLLAAAAYPANDEVVKLLVDHGADVAAKNQRDESALDRAVWSENVKSVGFLLERLRDGGKLGELGKGAWHALLRSASTRGNVQILETLRAHLPAPDLLNGPSKGTQPLHSALLAQRADAARWLVDHGVDLSGRTPAGDVPTLLLATYFEPGEPAIVRALLDRGADPASRNARGETALTWARRRGHPGVIDVLARAGSPDRPDETPEIPHRLLNLHAGNRREVIRDAISGSLDLMQRSSEKFLDERKNCVSCHHQNLPGVAISLARDRGFAVDEAAIDRMLARQAENWGKRLARTHEMGNSVPVPPRFLGWGLWAFSALGYPQDLITDSFVRRLAVTQRPEGRWTTGMTRPPMGGGDILSTALVIRALRDYPPRGHETEMTGRIERAVEWLRKADPAHHQEEIFRLFGLVWAGVPASSLESAAASLRSAQRADGGWAQQKGLESDAWATGETLVALHHSGHLRADGPAYRRGVEFLLRTRFDDGSWFVKSRAWPFQTYFESGFPHGDDQWLSVGATAWAVMALTLAVEPGTGAVVRSRSDLEPPANTNAPIARSRARKASASGPQKDSGAPAIDFVRDIASILARSCSGCHGGAKPESGLVVTSRLALIEGGESGDPAIVPGRSDASPMVEFVTGSRKDMEMPPLDARRKYPPLSEAEVRKLRAWIDQGAVWPEGATVSRPRRGTLEAF